MTGINWIKVSEGIRESLTPRLFLCQVEFDTYKSNGPSPFGFTALAVYCQVEFDPYKSNGPSPFRFIALAVYCQVEFDPYESNGPSPFGFTALAVSLARWVRQP